MKTLMKRAFHFTSIICALLFVIMFTACSNNSAVGGGVSTAPRTAEVMIPSSEPEEKYIVSGFDIRTIGKYPEIERAIQVASGHYEGDLKAEDFLKVTELNLDELGIKDLTPLAGLPNLTSLRLFKNGIDNISPLAGLVHLKMLDLRINNISDILPLSKMTELTGLLLSNNQIVDISPLSDMDKITDATLSMNKIHDLTPLAGWKSIERLSLNSNPIEDITPLGDLDSLLQVNLVDCPVKDFSPVAYVSFVEPYERKAVVLN